VNEKKKPCVCASCDFRVFDLPVSRKEIADYIGMSTANVIRTLSDFKKEGIIRVFGKTIEVVDVNKLEVISKRG